MYDRWSLDVLYTGFDDEKFQGDLKKFDEMLLAYQQAAENLKEGDVKGNVKKVLLLEEEFTKVVNSLFSFCSLRQSANTSDTDSVSYMGRLMQKMGDATKAGTIIEKYIASIEN